MRCERAEQLYDEYSRGSLSVSTMNRVEEHLAACPACRRYYEQMDDLSEVLRQNSEVAHPGDTYFDDLNKRVLAQLDADPSQAAFDPSQVCAQPVSAWWRRPLWWSGAAAAAALMAVAVLPLTTPEQGPASLSKMAQGPTQPAQPEVQVASAQVPPVVEEMVGKDGTQRIAISLPTPAGLEGSDTVLAMASSAPASSAHSLDKGLTGIASNPAQVEDMISPPLRTPQTAAGLNSSKEPLSEAEQKAAQEAEIKMVALKEQLNSRDSLPTEVFEQIQIMKTQMLGHDSKDFTQNLRQLEASVRARLGDSANLNALPLVRQARIYLKAEDALAAGRPRDAATHYMRIPMIDSSNALACRANLQLGDLFFSEWTDFQQARDYYQKSRQGVSTGALSSPEVEHLDRQLERLNQYRDNNWEALHLLDVVRRGAWSEVPTALQRLMDVENYHPLQPEAVRMVCDRMFLDPQPTAEMTVQIYNLLANRVSVEDNGDIRAWLELALGDLAILQFNDASLALEHYRRATSASADSKAAQLARGKLDNLIERSLVELVR